MSLNENENEHDLEHESSHGQEGLNETHNNSLHSELDDDNYLEEAYMSALGRSADAEGKAYWLNELQTGHVDRNTLSTLLSNSEEGHAHAAAVAGSPATGSTLATLNNGDYLELAYKTVLGRSSDDAGKSFWLNELETGHVDRNSLLNAFSDSAEGQEHTLQTTGDSTTLSNANYVEEAYHSVLGRSSDDAGKSFWLNELETGHIDRASLLEGFSESEEGHAHLALIGISPTTPDAALTA